MRMKILILLGIILVSFVGADGSSEVETNYYISGCGFSFEGEMVYVPLGHCSDGEGYIGEFYCTMDEVGWITRNIGLGCSRGETTYTPGTAEGPCCPDGYWCNETSPGQFICTRNTRNCYANMSKDDCEAEDIDGYYYNGICICNRRDYDCGIYGNEPDCEEDILNLGQIGIGTEFCGTTMECNDGTIYTISEDECGCEWYPSASEGKRCQVRLVGVQMFYYDIDTRDEFWCSNVYESGECIDGEQNITWYSTSSADQGFETFGGILPEDCLDMLGCNGGEATRFCGEPIIKLFGFSLFSLFASLFIVGIYYFLSQNTEGLNKGMY